MVRYILLLTGVQCMAKCLAKMVGSLRELCYQHVNQCERKILINCVAKKEREREINTIGKSTMLKLCNSLVDLKVTRFKH